MTRLFPARRRAERFDSWVDGERHETPDARTADLLEVVGALRSTPQAQARPEFVADLRERLMVAAETELVAAPAARDRDAVARLTIKPTRTRRERRVGVALGAAAIIGATTSMALASQSAIPGDALYPVKRAIENTQAGFSVGDDAKGETILGNASGRLDEVDKLSHQKKPDAALVTATLETFADQATQAGDLLLGDYEETGNEESIQELQQFTSASVQTLGALEASIPKPAHDALLNAAQVVFNLDAVANQVCPLCGEPLTEVPPQLLAGAASAVDQTTEALAGGELPGASPGPSAGTGLGGKDKPSTLNPPETPITLPSTIPTLPGDDTTGTGGTGLPTGTTTSGGGGNDGKGGKGKPVDLTPVTETVNQSVNEVTEAVTGVVTGVVEGVNDVLNGLAGGGTAP